MKTRTVWAMNSTCESAIKIFIQSRQVQYWAPVVIAVAVTLFLISWPGIGRADLREDLSKCRAIEDSTVRLDCFDHISSIPEPAPIVAVAPAKIPVAPPPSIVQEETFGRETVTVQPKAQVSKLSAKIVGRTDIISKGLLLKLDNGQTWRSIDDRDIDFDSINASVIIERNFIGSYWMTLSNSGYRIRVRRVT